MKPLEHFLIAQNNQMEALYIPVLFTNWMAATTGDKEWSNKHEKALSEYFANFSNPEAFKKVETLRGNSDLKQIERRQLDDLFNKMVTNQMDKNMREKTLEIEKDISHAFNTFRPFFEGKEVTNNHLLNVLKTSQNLKQRKEAWMASKQIGQKIEEPLLQLVRKRNANAQALGYDDFYQMSFQTQELDLDTVFEIFHQLKSLSDETFRQVKEEIDVERSEKLGIKQEDLRPWHYVDPFFQEAPPVSGMDIDTFYKGKNLEQIVSDTFRAMGLEIEDILERSDLYPREKKNPFGFCTNVDRKGDVRVLVNLDDSSFWATALLHEFGHAVYFKYIDRELPFILRFHSHTITTEAIALFFGRMNKTLDWQKRFLEINDEQIAEIEPAMNKMLKRQMLISTRWIITFSFFERSMYENPEQDLNQLWWKLVKDFQYINPPEDTSKPDWASKMHFSLAPVSYQDYLLGELSASQLQCYIEKNISLDLFTPTVGEFLKDQFFSLGASLPWNKKMKQATGEYLNPVYFIDQFFKA